MSKREFYKEAEELKPKWRNQVELPFSNMKEEMEKEKTFWEMLKNYEFGF